MDNNGKINRGIDLGTTNSAIAVMENGVAVIKKSATQKDTIPSVVSVTRRGIIQVGDTAEVFLTHETEFLAVGSRRIGEVEPMSGDVQNPGTMGGESLQ